jgi:hypothetical protein
MKNFQFFSASIRNNKDKEMSRLLAWNLRTPQVAVAPLLHGTQSLISSTQPHSRTRPFQCLTPVNGAFVPRCLKGVPLPQWRLVSLATTKKWLLCSLRVPAFGQEHSVQWRAWTRLTLINRVSNSVTNWPDNWKCIRVSRVRFPMRSLDFFNWPNPSSLSMALGSTQPLTEMSTRNLSGGKWQPARKVDNLNANCEPIV